MDAAASHHRVAPARRDAATRRVAAKAGAAQAARRQGQGARRRAGLRGGVPQSHDQQMFTGIGEGPFGGGGGAGVWRSFLTDEYAKTFAKSGGIGIADHV